jgi:hypothetical protein
VLIHGNTLLRGALVRGGRILKILKTTTITKLKIRKKGYTKRAKESSWAKQTYEHCCIRF